MKQTIINQNQNKIEEGIGLVLDGLGIPDWKDDENFTETPARVARAFLEFTKGLRPEESNGATFPTTYNGIVFFRAIEAIGLCPHHLLPIEYSIAFAYIPVERAIGLSKIPRIIKYLSARPVLQEDLTKDIIDYFQEKLSPLGIAVVVSGVHGCMKYRGIKEREIVKTAQLSGVFYDKPQARQEFYELIKKGEQL